MIEEVVNSILDAEDVAKQRISDAEKKAAEIVAAAEVNAEKTKKQAAERNKTLFAEQMRQAEAAADTEAGKTLASVNSKTDEQIAAYEKNIDKAVKIILESL